MIRQTLLVVVSVGDEHLLHLAGTMLRYGWQGIRTVLVVLDDDPIRANQTLVERVATLLGVEQLFYWQSDTEIAPRLARTFRAFQPQIILATTQTTSVTEAAWQMATDATLKMPGVSLLADTQSELWVSQGSSVAIEVPLTKGIRHALACLWLERGATGAELRRTVEEQTWATVETFTWQGGTPPGAAVSDFFGKKTT